MKYIEIHKQTNRVHRVEDALPSSPAEASHFTECPDDSVAVGWWINPADNSVNAQKTWDIEEARRHRKAITEKSKMITEKYKLWWDKDKHQWKEGFEGHGNP